MSDQKTALYQALWRKALTHPTEITIPCRTDSDAKYLRLELYRAVKKFRDNRFLDHELTQATEQCSCGVRKSPCAVVLTRKAPQDNVLAVAAMLGIDVSGLQTAAETELDLGAVESQRKFMENLNKAAAVPAEIPVIVQKPTVPSQDSCEHCKGAKVLQIGETVLKCPHCAERPAKANRYYSRKDGE